MLNRQSIDLFEKISDVFIVLDRQWNVIYMNYYAETFWRKRREDILGKSFWILQPEAVASTFYTKCLEAAETDNIVHFDEYFASSQVWSEIRICPIGNCLLIYFFDITLRKQIEQALYTSEQLQQGILDSLIATIAILDPQGTIVAVNEDWKQFAKENGRSQYEEGSDVGTNYLTLLEKIQEDDLGFYDVKKVLKGIKDVIQGALPSFTHEYPCHSPTQKRWFFMNVIPLPQMRGAVIAHTNITEQKLAEEALRISGTLTKCLLNSKSIGVAIADSSYILEANDAFLNITEYSQDDVQKRCVNWWRIIPPNYENFEHAALQELVDRGFWTPFEKEYYHKDAITIPVEIIAVKLQDDPLRWICFILDISERKNKELEQRKDDFIGMASHELRTPITALKGLTQLLKKKLERRNIHEFDEYLSKMERQIISLTKLIEELLDVSKIQVGTLDYAKDVINVNELLNESVEIIQQTPIAHTISIYGESYRSIIGDREKLKQVVINLLINAIKYSPKANKVDITVVTEDHMVTISIHDYGIGIPQSHQSKVFQRFYRIPNSQRKYTSGLGMGLYIVHEIIQKHGGKIWLESTEGVGSTFYISFPSI